MEQMNNSERESKKTRLEQLRASGGEHQASMELMMDKMMEMQMKQAEMFQQTMNAQQSMFQQMMTEFIMKEKVDADTVAPLPLAQQLLGAAGSGIGVTPAPAPRSNVLSELADRGSFNAKEWETAAAAQLKKTPPASNGQIKAIKSVGSDFRTKLHQLLNAEDKLQQLKDRQVLLNDSKPAAGIKPYSQPWDFLSIDEPSSHQGKVLPLWSRATSHMLKQGSCCTTGTIR